MEHNIKHNGKIIASFINIDDCKICKNALSDYYSDCEFEIFSKASQHDDSDDEFTYKCKRCGQFSFTWICKKCGLDSRI